MWIRSQDKTVLLKAECIEYISRREQITKELKDKKGKPIYYLDRPAKEVVKETMYHCILINNLNCGKYSTYEKALKVLDLLEKHINSGGRMFVTDQTKTDFGMSAVYERKLGVFQFPQDNEV